MKTRRQPARRVALRSAMKICPTSFRNSGVAGWSAKERARNGPRVRSPRRKGGSPSEARCLKRGLLLAGLLLLILQPGSAAAQQNAWEKATAEGQKALSQGNFSRAEQQFVRAVQEAEKFGPHDLRLADTLGVLADLYRAQAKYDQAEPLYQRRIAILESALGPDRVILASALSTLAGLYQDLKQPEQAESLLQRSLALWEKAWGRENPTVAQTQITLAEVYRVRAKYAEAEELYRQSLATLEKILGEEHPQIAAVLSNMAGLY